MFNTSTKKTNLFASKLIDYLRTLEKGVKVRILSFDGINVAGVSIGVNEGERSTFSLVAQKHLAPMVIMVSAFEDMGKGDQLLATIAKKYQNPFVILDAHDEALMRIIHRNEKAGLDIQILRDRLIIEGITLVA